MFAGIGFGTQVGSGFISASSSAHTLGSFETAEVGERQDTGLRGAFYTNPSSGYSTRPTTGGFVSAESIGGFAPPSNSVDSREAVNVRAAPAPTGNVGSERGAEKGNEGGRERERSRWDRDREESRVDQEKSRERDGSEEQKQDRQPEG